jgi:hypothetical protein
MTYQSTGTGDKLHFSSTSIDLGAPQEAFGGGMIQELFRVRTYGGNTIFSRLDTKQVTLNGSRGATTSNFRLEPYHYTIQKGWGSLLRVGA